MELFEHALLGICGISQDSMYYIAEYMYMQWNMAAERPEENFSDLSKKSTYTAAERPKRVLAIFLSPLIPPPRTGCPV